MTSRKSLHFIIDSWGRGAIDLFHSDNAPPDCAAFSLPMGNRASTLWNDSYQLPFVTKQFNTNMWRFCETGRHFGVTSINMLMQEHQYADTGSTLCQLVLLFYSSSLAEFEIKMKAKCLNINPDKTAEKLVCKETPSESMTEIIRMFGIIGTWNINFR